MQMLSVYMVCADTLNSVQFTSGELSRADGVGFVFSQRLPCALSAFCSLQSLRSHHPRAPAAPAAPGAKNIQRIVSIFAQLPGHEGVQAN